jgi:Outer membrane protein beta-barrel domain
MRKEPAITAPNLQPQSTVAGRRGCRRVCGPAIGLSLLLLVLVSAAPSASAQTVSRVQVFGGYSYTRFESRTLGFADNSDLSGWNASVAFNVLPYLGGVGEISGQYGSHINFRDVAFGPQILYPRWNLLFFGHALFGKGRSFDDIGFGQGDTQRAYMFGGGVDMDVPHHQSFAIRVQGDYIHSNLFNANQQNVRISVGLVYHWHPFSRRHRAPSAP